MNKIIAIIVILLISDTASAQYAYFATQGKISYDKITFPRARMRSMQQNVNQHTQGRSFGGRMFDLENIPESSTEKYILEFDEISTLMYFEPNTETPQGGGRGQFQGGRSGFSQMRGSSYRDQGGLNVRPNNSSKTLFQNLKNSTSEVQIEIDDKYIITDSLNEITWRFADEYRNIAGYECRRVNGSTKDSLYLVAFYTEEIPISGGPALSYGLPGMILGLAIPEMHIQYWATKVDYTTEPIRKDWKDKKSKSLKINEFISSFGRFFQRRGDNSSSKRQVQEQLIY